MKSYYALQRALYKSKLHPVESTYLPNKKLRIREYDFEDKINYSNNFDNNYTNDFGYNSSNDTSYKTNNSDKSSDCSSTSDESNNNSIEKDNSSDEQDQFYDLVNEMNKVLLSKSHDFIWHNNKEYISFNIKRQITVILYQKYNEERVDELTQPLFEGSTLNAKTFHESIRSFVNNANLTEKLEQDLTLLLRSILPDTSTINAVFNKKYKEQFSNSVVFLFHACICGSTVYEGDNSSVEICSVCERSRYTDFSKRYPIFTLNYRSITIIICELLETKFFLEALEVVNLDCLDDNIYSDIMNTSYTKKLVNDMQSVYNKQKLENKINNNCKPINLVLNFSYDGAQIYKYSYTNFWPMLITIVNLPPVVRKTVGQGMFMVSLFNSIGGSINEEFIFNKCLVEELLLLNEGIEVKINNKLYFIQARLNQLGFDTKALEAVVKAHGSNSKVGCPLCRLSPG